MVHRVVNNNSYMFNDSSRARLYSWNNFNKLMLEVSLECQFWLTRKYPAKVDRDRQREREIYNEREREIYNEREREKDVGGSELKRSGGGDSQRSISLVFCNCSLHWDHILICRTFQKIKNPVSIKCYLSTVNLSNT